MKILFAGTPDFAAVILKHLIQADLKPLAVWTQPDRPKGRGKKLEACPTKQLAQHHQIECFSPKSLKAEAAQKEMAQFGPDLLIVAAYGLILPQAILDIPKFGCINVHASLLPLWRGAAPITRSIWAGDTETGITLMQMDAGLDTGNIIKMKSIPILPNDHGQSLHDKLAKLGGEMMASLLQEWPADNVIVSKVQPDNATYAHKLSKEDGHINWHQSAKAIERQIRALHPWPGTYAFCGENRLKIVRAEGLEKGKKHAAPGTITHDSDTLMIATEDGLLNIKTLQLPGKKVVDWADMRHGQTIFKVGEVLS